MNLSEENKEELQPQQQECTQQDACGKEAPEKTHEQELEDSLAQLDDKYKRVLAEYQNFRARSQKEREGLYLDNVASTAAAFLPVIDTLERAYGQEKDEGFKKSLELIIKQYSECLGRLGIKPYGMRGDVFDPQLHNAVMHVEDEELEASVIAEVLLKGYMLGERVVRHAMVKVAN